MLDKHNLIRVKIERKTSNNSVVTYQGIKLCTLIKVKLGMSTAQLDKLLMESLT